MLRLTHLVQGRSYSLSEEVLGRTAGHIQGHKSYAVCERLATAIAVPPSPATLIVADVSKEHSPIACSIYMLSVQEPLAVERETKVALLREHLTMINLPTLLG